MRAGKLLFVTDVFPYPLDRGDRVRISNLLQACAQVFEVTLVVSRPPAGMADHVPAGVSRVVFVDFHSGRTSARQLFHALQSAVGLPFGSSLSYRMAFLRTLDRLDLDEFDLIWAERPQIGRLFVSQCARTVVDYDDVEHLRLRRLMSLQRVSKAWAHNLYKYVIYWRAECKLFRRFARVIVCAEHDRDYLLRQRAGAVGIVPNGAVVPDIRGPIRPRTAGTPLRVLFFGNMAHPPNDDAVRFLADEVLPGTGSTIAGVDVIGSNVSDALRAHCAGRINFVGFVDDLAGAMRNYDVLVAPIRYGGGTKLKVIDAMSQGLPVIATHCAAEGLDLVDGKHALLASTPEALREALARLVASPQLGEDLAAAAFAHTRERFAWSSIQATLAAELRRLWTAGHAPVDVPARSKTVG